MLLLAGQDCRAQEAAGRYRDIFRINRSSWSCSLRHPGTSGGCSLPQQIALARSLDIPLSRPTTSTRCGATPSRTTRRSASSSRFQSDPKRLKFDSDEFYLEERSGDASRLPPDPRRPDNTLRIAERVELDLVYGDLVPPINASTCHGSRRPIAALEQLGAPDRCPNLTDDIRRRIDDELDVITHGVRGLLPDRVGPDPVRTRERDPRGTGSRLGGSGSACGSPTSTRSATANFERFLNPAPSAPDIDMDFADDRRDEVIRYATERDGSDRRGGIIMFQMIKGKQGIRDAARVLGFPAARRPAPARSDRYGPRLPDRGRTEGRLELREAYEKEPEAKEIVDTARALEGLRREDSVHAAGVVIGDAPLVNYLPLKLSKDSAMTRAGRDAVRHDRVEALGVEHFLEADALRDRRQGPPSAGTDGGVDIDHIRWTWTLRRPPCSRTRVPPASSRWSPRGCARSSRRSLPTGSSYHGRALPARPAEPRDAYGVRRAQARAPQGHGICTGRDPLDDVRGDGFTRSRS